MSSNIVVNTGLTCQKCLIVIGCEKRGKIDIGCLLLFWSSNDFNTEYQKFAKSFEGRSNSLMMSHTITLISLYVAGL